MSDRINGRVASRDHARKRHHALGGYPRQPQGEQVSDSTANDSVSVVVCGRCGVSNTATRKFCQECGAGLWENCPTCSTDCPAADSFCGNCGEDLAAAERLLVQESQEQLSAIEEMSRKGELEIAIQKLRALTNEQTHPCLESTRTKAKKLLKQIVAERDHMVQHAADAMERAKELCDRKEYTCAVGTLEEIPKPFRDTHIRSLLVDTRKKTERIQELKNRLRKREGVTELQRLGTIDQLLTLCPRDTRVIRSAVELRERVMKVVHRALRTCQYQTALSLLEAIPSQVVNKAVKKTQIQVTELAYLASELELAPHVTPATIEAGKRLLRFDPGNQRAKRLVEQMIKRHESAKTKSPTQPVPWSPCPEQTSLDAPVDVASMPSRTRFVSLKLEQDFSLHPGRYYTACGLALQGLGATTVGLNLKPGRSRRFTSLYHLMRKKPFRKSWGIAIGDGGIAAVCLALKDDAQVIIECCQFVPH